MLPPDKISYPEFEAVFDKVIEWKVKYEVNMALEAAKVGQATTPTSVEAKARRKFRQFDKDGSGSLEGAEIDAMAQWVERTDWVDFLAADARTRSSTSITLKISDPWFVALGEDEKLPFIQAMIKPLDDEGVAYDIKSYKAAPAGLRIWGGTTIESADITALTPWLDWAYGSCKLAMQKRSAA
jgi:hypothetical protein